MSAVAADPGRPQVTAGRFEVLAERVTAVGVGVLVLIGFVASYATLRDLAATVGAFPVWLAPVVPLSFDLGIVVLSLKVVLAARQGRAAPVMRALVVALSAATVLANGAASPTAAGRLMHAVPSAMFVICLETTALGARRAALKHQAPRQPFASPARWLLAPSGTFRAWRRHILHRQSWGQVVATGAPFTASDTDTGAAYAPAVDAPVAAAALPAADGSMPAAEPAGRLAVALAVLAAAPDTTAVALAAQLAGAGHPVSVRTAQRIRAQAHTQAQAQQAAVLDAG